MYLVNPTLSLISVKDSQAETMTLPPISPVTTSGSITGNAGRLKRTAIYVLMFNTTSVYYYYSLFDWQCTITTVFFTGIELSNLTVGSLSFRTIKMDFLLCLAHVAEPLVNGSPNTI